jgi:single-stranded DNA-binding protein
MNERPFVKPKSRFRVQGVLSRDPFQGPNYSFLTVRDGDSTYLDVSCWEDGPLEAFRGLRSGMEVMVEGYISKRKVKNSEPLRYEIALVAETVRSRQPQYQQPVQAVQVQQPAYQQQHAAPQVAIAGQFDQQRQPAATNVTAGWGDDNIPF